MYEFLNKTYFYHDFASMFGIGLYPLPLNPGGGEMTEKQETMFNALFSSTAIISRAIYILSANDRRLRVFILMNSHKDILIYNRNNNFEQYEGLAQNMYEFLNKTYFYHDFASMFGSFLPWLISPLQINLFKCSGKYYIILPKAHSTGGGEMTEKQETMFNALFSHGSTRYKNLKYQLYSRDFDIL